MTASIGKQALIGLFNMRLTASGRSGLCLMPGYNSLAEVGVQLGTPFVLGALTLLALPIEYALSRISCSSDGSQPTMDAAADAGGTTDRGARRFGVQGHRR